jgi:DNA-binding response OmpR family regulator
MPKKLLIVDDEYDIAEPLSLLFSSEGYTVATVTKGDETYEMVKKFRPDLILLDILMSGSDGRTICRNLKNENGTKKIPIIMMSAHPTAEKDSAGCGADGFIAKPFDSDALLDLVKKYLTAF